ncbi:GNAT family N-acetyltransferase [Thalassotalea sp. 1_MG-2023]|uniref:GNAT family N-acetyltransferase n=1 Tax=Thalassotalea sp. 1_MG-2023 TaxID=3062680 RepID=UPI0026E1BFB0|nr:GNAT family N-acetyltransferase [Thalassotalea sp. 1_MG-2023]MDO6427838.1 GNAT family N-acetyltransferase [Thalassotalea sp. 1_MG-2023]
MITIETKRLILRLLTHKDANMILALLNEPAFLKNIGDKGVRDLQSAKNYIDTGPLSQLSQYGFCLLCVVQKSSNRAIGLCGLIKRDGIKHPEIGYALLADFHGKGLAYEAAESVISSIEKSAKLSAIQAICHPNNSRSIALLTKLKFMQIAMIALPDQDEDVLLFERKM